MTKLYRYLKPKIYTILCEFILIWATSATPGREKIHVVGRGVKLVSTRIKQKNKKTLTVSLQVSSSGSTWGKNVGDVSSLNFQDKKEANDN